MRLLAVLLSLLLALLPGPIGAGHQPFQSPAGPVVRLEPAVQSVGIGESVSVAVLVDNVSDLYGLELRLRFDPTRLQVRDTDVERDGVQIPPGYFPLPTQGAVLANFADNGRGTIDYAVSLAAPAQPLSGSGTAAGIDFVATAPGESVLRLESARLTTRDGEVIPVVAYDGRIVAADGPGAPRPTPTGTPTVVIAASPTSRPSATSTLLPLPSATAGSTPSVTPTAYPVPGTPSPGPSTTAVSRTPGGETMPPTSTTTPAIPATTPTPRSLPPAGFDVRSTWHFAEGSTRHPFDTWLLLQNPGWRRARVRVLFMRDGGAPAEFRLEMEPTSRRSIFVNAVAPDSEVAMVVQADSPVQAERAMYFGTDGHAAVGIASPATRWYLAEESTEAPFQTWILLQNPGSAPAFVTIRYLPAEGPARVQRLAVAPFSRATVYANLVLPDAVFSAEVQADQPVVVERSTYMETGGGRSLAGIREPSRLWYLAEGSTEEGMDTWILLQNPGSDPASATLTTMMPNGKTARFSYLLPPAGRTAIQANRILPPTRFGATVESNSPIVVERVLYFGDPIRGTHASVASPVAATTWYLPEGSTAEPFHEYLLLLNPGDSPTVARVIFLKEDGFGLTKDFPMLPTSRLTIDVNREVPDANVSTKVVADRPIVVERTMYFAEGQGGTCSVGIPGS